MIQHIRWQVFIALSGILLLLTLLGYLSTSLETVLLPEAGGTYTEGLIGAPTNLNPLFLQTRTDQDIAALLFNGLTRPNEQDILQPDLARRWDISEDGKQYTFYLRDDVLWHDGSPFTAQDVAYTIGVLRDPAYTRDPAASELWRAVTLKIEGPYTISFTLPDELAPFAPFLSFTTFGILPSHLLGDVPVESLADSSFSHRPLGTGAWRVAFAEPEQIVLEPHPALADKPLLEHLAFRFYESTPAAMQAYGRGEIMGIARVMPDELGRVMTDPTFSLHSTILSGYSALFFNLNQLLFQNRELREALMVALDRGDLVEEVLNGQGVVADSFLMPTHWAYDSDLPRHPYDPDEALQLMQSAGWFDSDSDGMVDQDGLPLHFSLLVEESDPQQVALVRAVVAQWRKLGIDAEVEAVPAEQLEEALSERSFDMVLLSTSQGGLPVDPDFYPLWHSSQATGAGKNFTSFSNEMADRLLVEARHTLDMEQRRALYQEFQGILARELPALPLYYPIYNYALSDRVRNVQVGPLNKPADRFESLPEWSIRTKRLLVERTQATQDAQER